MVRDLYEFILEITIEGYWDWDLKTDRAYLSPRYCETIGYSPEDTVFDSNFFKSIIHPDDRDRVFKTMEKHLQGNSDVSVIEYRMISKNGTVRWIEGRGKIVEYDDQGAPVRMVGTIVDISERKQVDEKICALISKLPDLIVVRFDRNMRHLCVSSSIEELTGLPSDFFIGKTNRELGMPEHLVVGWENAIKEVFETGKPKNIEFTYPSPEGLKYFTSDIIPEDFTEGSITTVIATTRDITERKRVEALLLKSESELKEAQRVARIGSWHWDAVDDAIWWSDQLYNIYGKDPKSPVSSYKKDQDNYTPESAQLLTANVQKTMRTGEPYEIDLELNSNGGPRRWVNARGEAVRNANGRIIGLQGTVQDITERKIITDMLRMNEAILRESQEVGRIGSYIFDLPGDAWLSSPVMDEILGIGADYPRTLAGWTQILHPTERERINVYFREIIAEHRRFEREYRIVRVNDGVERWMLGLGKIDYDTQGVAVRMVGIVQDITERKLMENDLRQSRDFLSETEKIGKVGGWGFDMDTFEQTWTEEVYRILEVDMDYRPTVEKGINFYTPSSRPILEKALQRAIEYGESFDIELELITAKGNLRSVHVICKSDLDKRRGFGFFQDITERKQAEEALKNSEERYHQLFEMESDTVIMLDLESDLILEANSAASHMYGYSRDEFLQLTPADLSNEPSETEKYIHNEEIKVALHWHRKKDGTVFPVEIRGSYFVYQGRNVHVAAIRDITERVTAEQNMVDLNQRLRALSGHLQSVQEQERLTISRDLHDDVGQILTALNLNLTWLEQNIAPSDNAVPLCFKDMHKHVEQMNNVIQRMAANLRPPLLDNQGLSAAIEWYVDKFSKNSGIECFVMINENTDSIEKETATAIMRIIQEGLTNIVRHSGATEVGISLCNRAVNLVLEITDNGCGITPEQIASYDAYGLMGMQERARICGGEFEIKSVPGRGTTLLLTIPQ